MPLLNDDKLTLSKDWGFFQSISKQMFSVTKLNIPAKTALNLKWCCPIFYNFEIFGAVFESLRRGQTTISPFGDQPFKIASILSLSTGQFFQCF
jgi:hypothetical protein